MRLRPERRDRGTERRFARRQWARRWLAWRPVLIGLVVLGAAGGLVWLVFFSSVLAVQGVRVAGEGVLDSREVRRVAQVPTGTPLATVDLDEIAGRVERLRPVRAVDVSREWPAHVRIEVTEREAVAVVELGDGLHGVDEEGVVFRRYLTRPAGLPLVRSAAGTPSDALAEATRVVDALPADLAGRVDHVEVGSVDTITLRLRDGRDVLWGSAEESANKARVLAVLLQQDATAYDVSVPGRPVLRR